MRLHVDLQTDLQGQLHHDKQVVIEELSDRLKDSIARRACLIRARA